MHLGDAIVPRLILVNTWQTTEHFHSVSKTLEVPSILLHDLLVTSYVHAQHLWHLHLIPMTEDA